MAYCLPSMCEALCRPRESRLPEWLQQSGRTWPSLKVLHRTGRKRVGVAKRRMLKGIPVAFGWRVPRHPVVHWDGLAYPRSEHSPWGKALVPQAIVGVLDLVTGSGLPKRDDEDLGQTLAIWRWRDSRYLVLPFLAASHCARRDQRHLSRSRPLPRRAASSHPAPAA